MLLFKSVLKSGKEPEKEPTENGLASQRFFKMSN